MSGDLSNRDSDWLKGFTNAMRPLTCTASDLDAMKAFMAKHGSTLPTTASKSLQIAVQEDGRCIAGRKLSQ